MELTGTVKQLLAKESGTGKKGQWTKHGFIVETEGQYPKSICISAFESDKMKALQDLKPGQKVNLSLNIESREYNGKWYTTATAYKLEIGENFTTNPGKSIPTPIEEESDDLPF